MKHILGIPYTSVGTQFTLVGSSYFASWGQTFPYLFNKISTHYQKSLIGYTTDGDNNGKTAHDRLRKLFNVHSGIAHPMTTFIYWSVNDMFYCQSSSLVDKEDLTILKVKNSHFTALAHCFSKTFNYFIDETGVTGTTSGVTDTSNVNGSKSYVGGKQILALGAENSSVEFESTGITNITYFVSDEENSDLGTFDVFVDDVLHTSVECNRQTIYFPNSYNNSIPTIGDNPISPNSLILELSGTHTIKIVSTSSLPVWLDFHSEIETSIDNGAKPVYSYTIPKMREDRLIGSTGIWTANRQHCIRINTAMEEVYRYWREVLKAPVAIADAYNGFDPINDMNNWECTHFSQSGSDFVIQRYDDAIINAFNGKKFIL